MGSYRSVVTCKTHERIVCVRGSENMSNLAMHQHCLVLSLPANQAVDSYRFTQLVCSKMGWDRSVVTCKTHENVLCVFGSENMSDLAMHQHCLVLSLPANQAVDSYRFTHWVYSKMGWDRSVVTCKTHENVFCVCGSENISDSAMHQHCLVLSLRANRAMDSYCFTHLVYSEMGLDRSVVTCRTHEKFVCVCGSKDNAD
jgi:hypothetical protein